MTNKVIKKDGSREDFKEEKIRSAIRAAAREGGVIEDRISQVVDQVAQVVLDLAAQKDEIATSELREIILRELDSVEPAAAQAWRTHEQSRKNL